MAGSISLSLSQQFDSTGAPLNGGTLQFYAAGTTTPQSAYQDVALTIPWPNPMILDSAGRIPAFYLADGQIKIRLASSAGVVQIAADNLLVIGASSGSGSPPSVDATKIYQTGDLKPRYGTGNHTGWVRVNGRTVGSATSGASERANLDCQDLFEYLWVADANLSVSTGRGVSANADWVANKTIALPDWRGYGIGALDDMGNSAAGRLTSTYFGTSAIVLGAAGGSESHTLTASQIPTITALSTGTTTVTSTSTEIVAHGGAAGSAQAGGTQNTVQGGSATLLTSAAQILAGTLATSSNNTGGTAHNNVPPMKLATIYMKL